ncbi:MAG: mannitol dehydrogenase family protein [Caulobacterales bacterium]|nr:mannitol dehydrogenase family protein [Caulobacterales bacterium]
MAPSPASIQDPAARLSEATLDQLGPEVLRPAYDRAATRVGIVHFGPGAFHRAHQAFYVDRMLAVDPGLAICGVSLNSDTVREALEPQEGLYSLTERDAEPSIRVIGAIRQVLTAPRAPQAVFDRLTAPDLRVVTSTVTEKGYHLTAGGELDLTHEAVRHDVAGEGAPRTLAGWLAEGLRRRRAAGLAPPVVISCDNLSGNGAKLGRSVLRLAQARGETDLAAWIAGEVSFPDSMVDSITPATDDVLRAEAAARLGLVDAWPIQRERFTQWVVADELGPLSGVFAGAGVTLTGDVAGFERAKLRLLNGSHSTLAYVGLALGCESVFEAMSAPILAGFVERLAREDLAASLEPTPGLDLQAYVGDVLGRFRNPAIVHRLAQIAGDGSQKLPIRLLAATREALAAGRPVARLAVGVAAWMQFVRRQAHVGAAIVDPRADELADLGGACSGDPAADVGRFLGLAGMFEGGLATAPAYRAALEAAYAALGEGRPEAVLV